jgi:hypothetical protein
MPMGTVIKAGVTREPAELSGAGQAEDRASKSASHLVG